MWVSSTAATCQNSYTGARPHNASDSIHFLRWRPVKMQESKPNLGQNLGRRWSHIFACVADIKKTASHCGRLDYASWDGFNMTMTVVYMKVVLPSC
eukprot:3965829-Amphidinium_carterae.1